MGESFSDGGGSGNHRISILYPIVYARLSVVEMYGTPTFKMVGGYTVG